MIQTLKKLGLILLVIGFCVAVAYAFVDALRQSDVVNCNKELSQSKQYDGYFITKLQYDICKDVGVEIDSKFIAK